MKSTHICYLVVTMPSSLLPIRPSSVMGTPEKPNFCLILSISETWKGGKGELVRVMYHRGDKRVGETFRVK